ncbi:MAG: NAD(P)-binding protein [Actinomycetota bacterium]|nr:NAD(P)-binding protein [Actinomycetota bacterium]
MTGLPRIAILGGGVGSVTAAIKLSKPGWEARFASITLYQQGWRLGGKGASGRGEGMRIEEHGLHIWFGFYENAFRMLEECHRELDQLEQAGIPRWPLAFKNVQDSFSACDRIALSDFDGCDWKLWTADFFEFTDDRPWTRPDPRPPGQQPGDWSIAYYAGRCLSLAADLAMSLVDAPPGLTITPGPPPPSPPPPASLDAAIAKLWNSLGAGVQETLNAAAECFDAIAVATLQQEIVLETVDLVARALELVLDWLTGRYAQFVRANDAVRRAGYVVDLMIAIVRGLIEDGVIVAQDFDVVNGIDFSEWLLSHGAREESVQSALVRTVVYDLAFAYRGGDPQRPAAEAGTALRGLLRTFFTYRGALMWKMNSGMGDVVFAPLYELLIKRGVKVEFFNRVEAVKVAGGRVERIEIDVQANVPTTVTPETYLRAGSLTKSAVVSAPAVWPNSPDNVLSAGGTSLAPLIPAAVYESWFADPADTCVASKVLKRGAPGDGFELVVFGLPIACVPLIAPDLPANEPRWQVAVQSIETVATQAVQLWLTQPAGALGAFEAGILVGGFFEPFDTWSDMHQLVDQEGVTGSQTVAYFCNVLADPPGPPPPRGLADTWLADRSALVQAQALQFLRRDVASLWPQATDPISRELYWDLLVDPSGATGSARLDAQFLRANVEPSERYVLSVPGSSACRIAPDDTGFSNLYAVGDWTACTLDAGCVEAAAISGLLAANGIFRSIGEPSEQTTIIAGSGP